MYYLSSIRAPFSLSPAHPSFLLFNSALFSPIFQSQPPFLPFPFYYVLVLCHLASDGVTYSMYEAKWRKIEAASWSDSNGCVQFYTINDIIPLIMDRKECTPTLFPAYIKEAAWLVYPDTVFLPTHPASITLAGKECRCTLFPAHYKGSDVIRSVILSTPDSNPGFLASAVFPVVIHVDRTLATQAKFDSQWLRAFHLPLLCLVIRLILFTQFLCSS